MTQSGRSASFDPLAFVHLLRDILNQLEVALEHDLLDLGCANGMFDVFLSSCCRSLTAVEPVPELVELARHNLARISNARVEQGHGAAVPASDQSFDRVLMLEVIQLIPADEVKAVFRELQRVTRPGGRIVIASVPDARKRAGFLESYLEGVRSATHLSEEQKAEIAERNPRASWYEAGDLIAWWKEIGASAEMRPLAEGHRGTGERFHLVVTV